MKRLIERIQKIFRRESHPVPDAVSEDELQAAFRVRYDAFQSLLTANNRALEIMTELEKALDGATPFGMSFVRSRCTGVCVAVHRMIQRLDELAPGTYTALYDRFDLIQSRLEAILSIGKPTRSGRLTIPLSAVNRAAVDEVGPKTANIAEVGNQLGIRIPAGFVITAAAYNRFLEANDLKTEIDRLIQVTGERDAQDFSALSSRIRGLFVDSSLPREVEKAVEDAYEALEQAVKPNLRVSMRSSARGEDIVGRAFAGQFRSELNVGRRNLLRAYKEVIASTYSPSALSYRISRGIPDEDTAMCVACMAMVDATAGGVVYSRDPFDIRSDSLVINSGLGLPKGVVDGSVETDLYVVSRSPSLRVATRRIGLKESRFDCDAEEGVCRRENTQEGAEAPSLTEEQVLELASLAVRIEEHFGAPQDIEWALDGAGLPVILQCRPLLRQDGRRGEIEGLPEDRDLAPVLAAGGDAVSIGVSSGPVHRISKESDMSSFPQGGVLVAVQALPVWATLLPRAAAVVTEMGSVTGHLANVAREFGVPALFGLKGAFDALPEGETVTVDADGGRVYAGRVDTLLEQVPPHSPIIASGPIHNTLKDAVEFIVPLNLTDPESPDFRPGKCRTLHDITRFIHEKSVEEMFSFGANRPFSRHAAKQLVIDAPMQFWIIDLSDGFTGPIEGKYVRMDQITSIPLAPLWRGMTAVPWEGPPPLNAGGFMSILMQATTNPGLDPTLRSPYSVRNYFMISKHFLSLTSRFGFHFSSIEALVSERAQENYARMVFKGGAADALRRVNRARLLRDVLEEFDFHVRVKDDAVFARIEGYSRDRMESRLAILGYLIMHTRQLDMALADASSIEAYRRKLTDQIQVIIEDPTHSRAEFKIHEEPE